MATQIQAAREGKITAAMELVAADEGLSPEEVRAGVASGHIAICANPAHAALRPAGIGSGLRTKVNASIGTPSDAPAPEPELEKLTAVVKAGADAVTELSLGGDIELLRRRIIEASPIMVGTVPIYQAAINSVRDYGDLVSMTEDDIFETIEQQAQSGVDFMTLHCGLTRSVLRELRAEGRIMDIVSRGGAFTAAWMLHNELENPLFEYYDRLLDICEAHDVTLSLGSALASGCLEDATDRAQMAELLTLGSLVDRARKHGVQVMVEGPGHVPYDQIRANMELTRRLCHGAPLYVRGPLVTDVAPGYDHVAASIGATLAAVSGADFLCAVTPASRLAPPTLEDMKEGVCAARVAAHAADIVKGVPGALAWDKKMAQAQRALDREAQARLALDPETARAKRKAEYTDALSMCSEECAMEIMAEYFDKPVCPFED